MWRTQNFQVSNLLSYLVPWGIKGTYIQLMGCGHDSEQDSEVLLTLGMGLILQTAVSERTVGKYTSLPHKHQREWPYLRRALSREEIEWQKNKLPWCLLIVVGLEFNGVSLSWCLKFVILRMSCWLASQKYLSEQFDQQGLLISPNKIQGATYKIKCFGCT